MNRRGFLLGLGASLAAPAVVRAASLMPVRSFRLDELHLYCDALNAGAFRDGSTAHPFKTVMEAMHHVMQRAFAGSHTTIELLPGVYDAALHFTPPLGVSTTLRASGPGLRRITGDLSGIRNKTEPLIVAEQHATVDVREAVLPIPLAHQHAYELRDFGCSLTLPASRPVTGCPC